MLGEDTSAPATLVVHDPVILTQPLSLPLAFIKRHADYSVADSARLDAILAEGTARPSAGTSIT